jgi:hypothetical protein
MGAHFETQKSIAAVDQVNNNNSISTWQRCGISARSGYSYFTFSATIASPSRGYSLVYNKIRKIAQLPSNNICGPVVYKHLSATRINQVSRVNPPSLWPKCNGGMVKPQPTKTERQKNRRSSVHPLFPLSLPPIVTVLSI